MKETIIENLLEHNIKQVRGGGTLPTAWQDRPKQYWKIFWKTIQISYEKKSLEGWGSPVLENKKVWENSFLRNNISET